MLTKTRRRTIHRGTLKHLEFLLSHKRVPDFELILIQNYTR